MDPLILKKKNTLSPANSMEWTTKSEPKFVLSTRSTILDLFHSTGQISIKKWYLKHLKLK